VNSLLFAADPTFVKDKMCYIGASRTYFEEGQTGPIASWITPDEIAIHEKIFSPSNGGYGPPLNWYKAQIANLNTPDEDGIEEAKHHLQQPTLLVTCSKDYIAVPAMQEMTMKPCVENLTVKEIDAGHRVQAEKPEELNKTLETFIV
jgi:soluble epoxide hydrolase/lipid-phosphate phosphatase